MKTIGLLLKEARDAKGLSLKRLEDITKIKFTFIEAVENEKWEMLPTFPTVLGFVKSLSATLDIDPTMTVAVLKRDYPPQKLKINPTPDVISKFTWSPKLSFFVGTGIVLLLIIGYLVYQYARFVSPPNLNVESPKQEQVIVGSSVLVFGKTDVDSKIVVNNQPTIVDTDGKFSISLGVSNDTKEVVVRAISRSGKVSEVKRKIEVVGTSN